MTVGCGEWTKRPRPWISGERARTGDDIGEVAGAVLLRTGGGIVGRIGVLDFGDAAAIDDRLSAVKGESASSLIGSGEMGVIEATTEAGRGVGVTGCAGGPMSVGVLYCGSIVSAVEVGRARATLFGESEALVGVGGAALEEIKPSTEARTVPPLVLVPFKLLMVGLLSFSSILRTASSTLPSKGPEWSTGVFKLRFGVAGPRRGVPG